MVFGLMSGLIAATEASASDDNPVASDNSLSFNAGAIGIVGPRYEGSKSYRAIGFPILYPNFTGEGAGGFGSRVSFKRIDVIRFNLFEVDNFQIGPVLGYRAGRDESDGVLLRGLGDIDAGLVVGGYAGYQLGPVFLDASLGTQVFGDSSGLQARLGAESEFDVSSTLKLTARVGATISSDEYMDRFFGVTAAQSATSTAGLPVYNPDSGFKDAFVQIGARFQISDQWSLSLRGRYTRLLGDAASSPVIETEDQFSGNLRLVYRFN